MRKHNYETQAKTKMFVFASGVFISVQIDSRNMALQGILKGSG
jgi:hypothetical protein